MIKGDESKAAPEFPQGALKKPLYDYYQCDAVFITFKYCSIQLTHQQQVVDILHMNYRDTFYGFMD